MCSQCLALLPVINLNILCRLYQRCTTRRLFSFLTLSFQQTCTMVDYFQTNFLLIMNVTLSGGPIVHQGKAAAYLAEYVNFFLRFTLLSHSHVSVILVSSKFSAETILFRDPPLFSSTALSDPAFLDASPSLLGTAVIAASRVCTNNFFHDWPFR